MILPTEAAALLQALAPAFTQPTFQRAVILLGAALLTTGCRTVANLLRTAATRAQGDASSFRRILSAARWSSLRLACLLTRFLLQRLLPGGTVTLVGDDTVCEHRGKHVYGKARHRDPVRSSHSYTACRYGHKWVVLAVLVEGSQSPDSQTLPGEQEQPRHVGQGCFRSECASAAFDSHALSCRRG